MGPTPLLGIVLATASVQWAFYTHSFAITQTPLFVGVGMTKNNKNEKVSPRTENEIHRVYPFFPGPFETLWQ
jgi:hypothetical protein